MNQPISSRAWSSINKWIFLTCSNFFIFNTLSKLFAILLIWHKRGGSLVGDWIDAKLAIPIAWLDYHFYHLGFNPKTSELWPDDNYYGLIYYTSLPLFFAILAVVIVWLWGKKINFDKLNYWIRLYLRYMLAFILFGYGIVKIIPAQMAPPFLYDLFTPLGDYGRYGLFWAFIGASKPYEIFAGICETVAALMLFNNRTKIFGLLTALTVMANVLAYNYMYNVSVKFYSTFIMLLIIWLLTPYIKYLFAFFFQNRLLTLQEKKYGFSKPIWNAGFKILLIIIPSIYIMFRIPSATRWYNKSEKNYRAQKLYEVKEQFASDSLFHNTPDSLRWKRFMLTSDGWNRHFAVCQLANDKMEYYYYKIDTSAKQINLRNFNTKIVDTAIFSGFSAGNNNSTISGSWRKRDMKMELKYIPLDSLKFNLNKPQFNFVQRDER
ncbi:MAG TPA: hypothetical protein VFN30_00945 [Chitinophagaceae bacterium]|nr:hypothetical protein [Chitinophagaceae bacterium]